MNLRLYKIRRVTRVAPARKLLIAVFEILASNPLFDVRHEIGQMAGGHFPDGGSEFV